MQWDGTRISRRTMLAMQGAALAVVTLPPAHAEAQAARLINPYDAQALRARKGKKLAAGLTCPAMPPPPQDILVPGFYTDPPVFSRVDPERLAQRHAAIKPFNTVVNGVTRSVDRWASSNPAEPRHAACAAAALDAMAKAGSAVGRADAQGDFERKWMFCALGLAHLKLASAPEYGPAAQKRVGDWFSLYLPQLRKGYDLPPHAGPGPSRQLNNLSTWAGLCAMVLSLAAGDVEHWTWGVSRLKRTLDQVDAEGFLPQELKRGPKALHYHTFALGPLVLGAFLARANGIDLVGAETGPLHRLARRVLSAYADPAAFEARNGQKQETFSGRYDVSWAEIYAGEFNRPEALNILADRRPVVFPWLGGDLTLWHARDV